MRRTFPEPRAAIADPIDEALQTSQSTFRSPRMFEADDTNAVVGTVHWKPVKSLWISAMTLTALIGGRFILHGTRWRCFSSRQA